MEEKLKEIASELLAIANEMENAPQVEAEEPVSRLTISEDRVITKVGNSLTETSKEGISIQFLE